MTSFNETKIVKRWERHYSGFESLYDLERDIMWAIEHEDLIPDGEWQGTLEVTMVYVSEDK